MVDITRNILKWCDKKFDESLTEPNKSKSGAKAFMSGAVEGLVDGLVMGTVVTTVAGVIVCTVNAITKK